MQTTASERHYLNSKLMTDILNMYTGFFFFKLWWGRYTQSISIPRSKQPHFKLYTALTFLYNQFPSFPSTKQKQQQQQKVCLNTC